MRTMTILLLAGLVAAGPAVADGGSDAIGPALAEIALSLCSAGPAAAGDVAARYGARVIEDRVDRIGDSPGRQRLRIGFTDGAEVRVARLFPGGVLRRMRVAVWDGTARPLAGAEVGRECVLVGGRRIDYDDSGRAASLVHLNSRLEDTGRIEPLNPAVPTGRDPGGVAVAQIDSGVNYLLPVIGARLARDADGQALGYDYWDMDDRPFDIDTAASPFYPLHHGTAVASILLAEAPSARLVPYRYPRPDMTRMADLIAAADKMGVIVVNVAMGSRNAAEWDAFAAAARARPHMLFILSAGNDGRDIDVEPVYPASLRLANALVVTSSDPFGRLARGSNWGRETVHVMVPGEQVPVVDHRGAKGKASGSSFAVPRITALAARLLARHPEWRAAELKAAILARARPSRYHPELPVRAGWIPDPADDG